MQLDEGTLTFNAEADLVSDVTDMVLSDLCSKAGFSVCVVVVA